MLYYETFFKLTENLDLYNRTNSTFDESEGVNDTLKFVNKTLVIEEVSNINNTYNTTTVENDTESD